MSGHLWLTDEQIDRLPPFFPKSRGKFRVDDRRVLSGIIYIKKNGLQWKDAPAVYGPPKTLYNRFVRWSRMGVFAGIVVELAQPGPDGDVVMVDSTHLQAHRTAASLSRKGDSPASHRTDQRRAELQAAHGVRRAGSSPDLLHVARPDERCERCAGATGCLATCQDNLGLQRLRRRLVP